MAKYTAPSEAELNKLLKRTFTFSWRPEYVTVEDFTLPKRYLELEKDIRNFEVRDTDLWICGYPKTGTTWISEIAWLILHDSDYQGAKEQEFTRIRYLETSMLCDTRAISFIRFPHYISDSLGFCRAMKDPRVIKSHLPFHLLPEQIRDGTKQPKIIVISRNPLDVCLAYYYHSVNYETYKGTFEEFCKLFMFDKVTYAPFSKHVLSFWNVKDRPNILFLTYEETKENTTGVITKISKFLGKTLSDEEVRKLEEHVSFESMKNNSSLNKGEINNLLGSYGHKIITPFMRSGKVGAYKASMPKEFVLEFQYWMQKRFEGSGLNLLDV